MRELILGGQRSGKSARAETRAAAWLAESPGRMAVFIATGQAWDEEMKERIARHQRDRVLRLPGMVTVEEPLHVAQAIAAHSSPQTLLVVDCLTLWLTNWIMPAGGGAVPGGAPLDELAQAIASAQGPLILVSNEIGLGVIPMGREVRRFVDELGRVNQQVAKACDRVTLMAAGLPLTLKDKA